MEKEKTITFETFRKLGSYDQRCLEDPAPGCFNGDVRIRKWRVTFEPVDEPVEVLAARLQDLWDNETNHHRSAPLKKEAKALKYILKGDMGWKKLQKT